MFALLDSRDALPPFHYDLYVHITPQYNLSKLSVYDSLQMPQSSIRLVIIIM